MSVQIHTRAEWALFFLRNAFYEEFNPRHRHVLVIIKIIYSYSKTLPLLRCLGLEPYFTKTNEPSDSHTIPPSEEVRLMLPEVGGWNLSVTTNAVDEMLVVMG